MGVWGVDAPSMVYSVKSGPYGWLHWGLLAVLTGMPAGVFKGRKEAE
jgi:hypothetical protein